MTLTIAILALVTLQRLGELFLSNRNTRRLLARGAHEVAPGRPVDGFWLAVFVLLQIARIWVIATLGERWTTRIIILPDAPLVARGPYRWVNHPNYLVVISEIAVLPLVWGLWPVALLFSALNAAVLSIRIREENRALRSA